LLQATSICSALLNIFRLKIFPDDEAVEREVTAWFRQQLKEFYAADFQGVVKRYTLVTIPTIFLLGHDF
jgi:hypothetical protein